MKRVFVFALVAAMMVMMTSPAMAITHFRKVWNEHYVPRPNAPGGDAVDPEFRSVVRKAGCFVCHVKGEDKKEVRNEYGNALAEFLDSEDYDKDRIKAEPEKVQKEILEAFKKVAEKKSKDGKTFGEKIKAGTLPATDAGL